jgi:hypothetical protein
MSRLLTLLGSAFLAAATFASGVPPVGSEAKPVAPLPKPVDELFTGTLAGLPAVAVLRVEADGVRSGTYFYRRRGRDIALVSGGKKGLLLECAAEHAEVSDEPCAAPSGVWSVTLSGDRLEGTWRVSERAETGKPISFVRAPIGPGDKAFARYEATRRALLSFADVSRHEQSGIAWRIVKEKLSGVTGPLLVSGPRPDVVARVNADLEAKLRDDAASRLAPGEYEVRHTVELANTRTFSVSTSTGWDSPGAAHPSNGFNAVTWDLTTGEKVEWSRVVRLVDARAPRLDLARKDLLAAIAIRRIVAGPGGDEEGGCLGASLESYGCSETTCEATSLYPGAPSGVDTWVLFPTEAGLAVVPGSYSEAERGCRGERIVVPWSEVRPALTVDRQVP